MKDLAALLPIFGMIVAIIFLTVAEIFALKFSKRVESPKFIWFPISANIVGLIVIFIITALAIALFAAGFIVAFGAGFDEGKKYFSLMMFSFVLIPALFIAVRTILFLLFRLGKFPIALLYSLITTLVNLFLLLVTVIVLAVIYENVLKSLFV